MVLWRDLPSDSFDVDDAAESFGKRIACIRWNFGEELSELPFGRDGKPGKESDWECFAPMADLLDNLHEIVRPPSTFTKLDRYAKA